ncbi:MAG: phospholipase C [Actinomycetota bacterium]
MPISRREFMQGTAAVAAGAYLASCNGSSTPVAKPYLETGRLDTQWPIEQVVFLMMENRSFDHMFGAFPGANGTTVGLRDGQEVPLLRASQWTNHDLPHDWSASGRNVNGGKMDAFDLTALQRVFGYTQYQEEDLPNYWRWAREFVLCDNFFASSLGNSYPNHLYMIAGQSGGTYDAPNQSPEQLRVRKDKGLAKTWGCDVPDGVLVAKAEGVPKPGEDTGVPPCFAFKTQGEQLTAEGVDWAFYGAQDYQVGYIWNAYAAIDNVFHDEGLWSRSIRPVDRLVQDIREDRLPSVTWVTPRYELSDHPPWSTCYGHNFVTSVVNAVMRSPMWKRGVAVFLTWDEWGGFYDHVAPPRFDDLGAGIRVPLLAISSHAQRGLVDHEQGEFSSVNRFVADNWGLKHLTDRVVNTTNYSHVFDFEKKRDPVVLPPKKDCRGTRLEALYDIEEWQKLPGWRPGLNTD